MEHTPVWDLAAELSDVLPISILNDGDRRELVSHMRVRRFRAGEVVYHRGDPAGDVFVVHRGLVKALIHDEGGHELLFALVGRGQFFGELTLFERQLRESTVVSVLPTTVLQIGRDDCLRVLERNPKTMYFMFERLADTIHRLSDSLEGIAFLDVPSRLAKYLTELDPAGSGALTQDDIAAAIASTRVTVNKTLADFERRGLIRIAKRRMEILDEPGLLREIRR
jgi:CRP/FNR family transcriptional regulator, cyclic AMP receptor protein